MEILKDLIKVVTKYRTRSIQVIGDSKKKTQLNDFYNLIANGTFQTDQEALEYFYGKDSSLKQKQYNFLKLQLRKRLLNTLFFIDVTQSQYNEFQLAYYTSYKDWAAIKILLGRQARTSAISLSKLVLKHAIKYEFIPLVVDISQTLRGHYATIDYNAKKYDRYNQIFRKYSKILSCEQEIEGNYYELIAMLNAKVERKFIFATADQHLKNNPSKLKSKAFRLNFFLFLIRIIKQTSNNDYQSCKKVCSDAIKFLKSKDFLVKQHLVIFRHQKLACHIQLKEYRQGEMEAIKGMETIGDGTKNWFKSIELYTLLALHSREYYKATELVSQTVSHPNFGVLYNQSLEIWNLYAAYMDYLGILPENIKFKLSKFLNEVPVFSKDKTGMNIPILLIQMLLLIKENEYDKTLDRIGAIEKYFHRYKLTNGIHARSYSFMKLLLLIPKNGFNIEVILKKSKKYATILAETPLEVASTKHNIEIIPYEDLWEITLGYLKRK